MTLSLNQLEDRLTDLENVVESLTARIEHNEEQAGELEMRVADLEAAELRSSYLDNDE